MEEIVKHINDTNASFRTLGAGDAKNTDLFLDNEHYELFRDAGEHITVRFNKENLQKAILFIASILPRKYDNSSIHKVEPFSSAFVFDQLALLDAFFTIDGNAVEIRTQSWNARKDVEKKNGEIDNRFYFNGLLEEVSYKDYSGVDKSAKFTIRNYLAGGYSDLHIKKADDGVFDIWITNALEPKDDGKERAYEVIAPQSNSEQSQIIYYGAPGTGKSHIVKKQTEGESVVRTTFHPDSDYSTFVGCYKPTTKPCPMYTSYGEKAVTIKDATGKELTENRIVYEFVDQAFLQAYVKAWKFYAQATEGSDPKKQYLIIEEINRGNCAQIFGDLFQLLDRNGRGFSDYYIHADNDLKRHIYQKFQDNGVTFSEYHQKAIDAVYPKEEESVALRVLSGEILLLPNNLYIWATMNTSDQSLFPIDSAFKRRWDWKYRPIVKGRDEDGKELKWRIAADTKEYDWWSFLEKINAVIGSTTSSEDKKLGFFFCKAIDGVISAETFVSKIIFYLWNDVFKDFGFDEDIFKDEISADGKYSTLDFDKFYTATANGETIVRKAKVEKFLENLKVEEATNVPDNADREDEDGNTSSSPTRDYTKYSINGVGKYGKNPLASECVKEYVKLHPELSAEEVVANWKSLGNIVPHFIESEEEHNARTDNSVRSIKIECGGEFIYVENNGYGNNGKVDILINAINQKDWGIKVGKIE